MQLYDQRMAARGSPSIEPKLPCPSIKGARIENSCAGRSCYATARRLR
jgi:hypothetical protein